MVKNLQLQFFAANSVNGIDHLYSTSAGEAVFPKFDDDYFKLWETPIEWILKLLESANKEKAISVVKNTDTIIQVLFVKKDHLKNRHFLHNLAEVTVETSYSSGEKPKLPLVLREIHDPLTTKTSEKKDFHPIITIGLEDFLSTYEESPNLDFEIDEKVQNWQANRSEKKYKYELELDPRIKFLDSSIWHRYVPYAPDSNNDDFEENFKKVLNKIITYANFRLYRSLAALSTLEFQCRMLQNSVIAQYGNHGHHEAVTPFKFHSETMMEKKIARFIDFFKVDRNGTSLMNLEWNMLLVDDYSKDKISIADEDVPAPKSKKEIIEEWLNDFDGKKIEFLSIKAFTDGKDKIISKGIQHLKEQTFDIILLDYLIGDSEIENSVGLKAYGHEFLLEIATSPDQKDFKRGPFGRYWVFPISSFPFAFTDKLKQLNIDGSSERWYIAGGGDPISTPELFRLNFFRLLMRQISEVYLHEAALSRQLSRYDSIQHLGSWCSAMIGRIEADVKNKELLMAERDNDSLFSEKMEEFLDFQKEDNDFLKKLNNWLRTFSNYKKGTSAKEYFIDLNKIKKNGHFSHLIDQIKIKASQLVDDAEEELIKEFKKGSKAIDFSQEYLYTFPVNLSKIYPGITTLNLSGNRLKSLPPSIIQLPNLEELDLSHNQELEYLPAKEILENCKLLTKLDLRGTKLGDMIKKTDYTEKKFPTQKLLEYIAKYNEKNGLVFFDISKEDTKSSISIYYAKNDVEWKDKLKIHLRSLELGGLATIWTDDEIRPGAIRDNEILASLNKSDIILLLISADFIASEYKTDFKTRIEQSGKKIIPIYLRPCYLEGTQLARIEGLPNKNITEYSNYDDAFNEVVKGLLKVIERKKSPPHNHRQ
jgi:Leucine-rich repeat (LRR) protein